MSRPTKPATDQSIYKVQLACGSTLEVVFIHYAKHYTLFVDGLPIYSHKSVAVVERYAMAEFLPFQTEGGPST